MTRHGVASPGEVAGLTGLEAMRAMAEGRLPMPTMARLMGMRVGSVAEGEVTFLCSPSGEVLNPMGTVHGGWAMTLLDSAMGCACHGTLAAGESYTSVDTSVRFVRAIRASDGGHGEGTGEGENLFRATGRVISRGRRIVVCEGRLESPEGRIHATGTSSCLVISRQG
jgi:uncharacterized protein (TIGR00369 family)